MSTPKINIVRGKGGLGRPLPNNDHISGLLFYNDTLPSGFGASDRIKVIYSLEQAVDLGIAEDGANTKLEYYQIKQFFRMQPNGKLYVGIYDVPATPASHDFAEVELIQNFATGEIRQLGIVFDVSDLVTMGTAGLSALQTKITALKTANKPLNAIIGFDDSGLANASAYIDVTAADCDNVSVVISQDGSNEGAALVVSEGKSVPAVGAILGAVSLAAVHENIGWVGKFNFALDKEFSEPEFTCGDKYKSIASSLENTLNTNGLIFLKNHIGNSGTFANYSWTATAQTGDYSTIENNRTIDKAIRLVREFMLPNLNSPLDVNTDGTLTETAIAILESDAKRALDQMAANGEIAAPQSGSVVIATDQNVVSTSKVVIAITVTPQGVAREIQINIGLGLVAN